MAGSFSTGVSRQEPTDYLELVPIGPIGPQREAMAAKINDLVPTQGTPLYTVTKAADDQLVQTFDAQRINAVLLLTDGKNEDERNTDLDGLLRSLRARNEGQVANPVRVFPIAYGQDADLPTFFAWPSSPLPGDGDGLSQVAPQCLPARGG